MGSIYRYSSNYTKCLVLFSLPIERKRSSAQCRWPFLHLRSETKLTFCTWTRDEMSHRRSRYWLREGSNWRATRVAIQIGNIAFLVFPIWVGRVRDTADFSFLEYPQKGDTARGFPLLEFCACLVSPHYAELYSAEGPLRAKRPSWCVANEWRLWSSSQLFAVRGTASAVAVWRLRATPTASNRVAWK